MSRIGINRRNPGVRPHAQARGCQRAGSRAEIDEVRGRNIESGERLCGRGEHVLVARNERPDTTVVFLELDVKVRGDAHTREESPATMATAGDSSRYSPSTRLAC